MYHFYTITRYHFALENTYYVNLILLPLNG